MQRRQFLATALLSAAPPFIGLARAQTYPTRPITMIVPYAAGGTGDVLGRIMAQKMSDSLGQNVLVELRPGAGGNIGAEYVAKQARGDGYTFLLGSISLAINVSLMKLGFDPRRELTTVAGLTAIPNLLVTGADGPYRTLADVVAAARRDPKALTFGSSGPGTGSHLAGELFQVMADVQLTHVPYKGSGAVYPDLIANRVNLLFDVMGSALGQVKSGRVRPLAITSTHRSPALPNVPTIAESYAGYELVTWFGFFAPASTPHEFINRLEQAAAQALAGEDVKERLAQLGAEPVPVTASEFAKYYATDVERWAKLVREGRIAQIQI